MSEAVYLLQACTLQFSPMQFYPLKVYPLQFSARVLRAAYVKNTHHIGSALY